MKVGDRVKVIKGNPLGKSGIIKHIWSMTGPVNVISEPTGLQEGQYLAHFEVEIEAIEAEDSTTFMTRADYLQLVE